MKTKKTTIIKVMRYGVFGVFMATVMPASASTSMSEAINKAAIDIVSLESDSVEFANDDENVYDQVEKMPEFQGGTSGLMQFLQTNITYPEAAKAKMLKGKVVAQFIVTKEGKVTEPTIVESIDPILDAEALRVISEMPDWTPGEHNGQKVAVRYTLPIEFDFQPDTKDDNQIQTTDENSSNTVGNE
ncbi:MAG: energy transducer TonB [Prevotella sp.]|nr:energy transducer TonB [Prevotella sp.]MCF0207820.1 energy transducer TonB [Bacteroidaceae bacterium]